MAHTKNRTDEPLYDPTAPIACTIRAAEIPGHTALVERLRDNLGSIDRTRHGVLLRFADASRNNADDVHRFAAEEKRCCQFWGFAVTEEPDLLLRWDGPPALADYMDRLVDYFEGRAPIGSLFGGL